ncbi:hypothetical protein C9374_005381 [Naegleria lovaniensis]|uniref:Uncharacterized protein n=1 Tax=Naegleria lovaniensis TaxID=51637 RepID=A0AA88GNC3_NAELO|nr:uncharacterized protein C9374_005381 [Naegleria lovaniensis]KAG2382179.1 hypothetical protein C9374_005381 [Naegleria lovaniensis]
MTKLHGSSVARSGRVRYYMTPHVPKTASHKYQGGCKKFRKASSSDREYGSGAHRLETTPCSDLCQTSSSFQSSNISQQLEERMNETKSPFILSNYFHKCNSKKGMERLEYFDVLSENRMQRSKHDNDYCPHDARNHKKWHRNHPQDGFYQLREIFDL